MIAIDILQELFALTLAMFIIRYVQSKLNSEGAWGKAIAYIYH